MCSLLNFSDMSKRSLVSSFVVVVVGLGEGRRGIYLFYFIFWGGGGGRGGWKICIVNVL